VKLGVDGSVIVWDKGVTERNNPGTKEPQMTKSFTISGFTFKTATPVKTANLTFYSQKELFAMATPAAYAELERRAVIIRARKAA
jgi:hypothetical protein